MTDSITNKHGTEIRVNQVWADADPRMEGRTLKIVDITGDMATCLVLTGMGGKKPTRYRGTSIRVDRLHPTSTGYRLLSEPTDTPAVALKRALDGWNSRESDYS